MSALAQIAFVGDPAERVATVLLALESRPAFGFRMWPAALGEPASRAVDAVCFRLADATWTITPAEARMVARCITFDSDRSHSGWLASLFESAACDAEALGAATRRTGASAARAEVGA